MEMQDMQLMSLGIQVLMMYGCQLIKSSCMSTGNLVSFILYQGDLGSYIRSLVCMYSNMLNSVGAAAKVFEYLDRKPLVGMDGSLHPETLTGKVHFNSLTFFYPTRPDKPSLKNFSLELKPGQMTALVGMSGGGKSTCVSLLERFYQPQQGHILLDGQPLQNCQHTVNICTRRCWRAWLSSLWWSEAAHCYCQSSNQITSGAHTG